MPKPPSPYNPLNLEPLRALLNKAYDDGYTAHRDWIDEGGGWWSDEELVATLAQVLTPTLAIEPCHVTGMHDPNHTERYLCDIQTTAVLSHLLAALGLHTRDLSHQLHPDTPYDEGGCYWCHNVPREENDREQLRQVWRWAGVEPSAELAALADDALRLGDDDLVASVLFTEHALTWPQVHAALDAKVGGKFNDVRANRALHKLRMDCRTAEYRSGTMATERLLTDEESAEKLALRDADTLLFVERVAERADPKYGYTRTEDVNRLAAGADDGPHIGYDRYRFVQKWVSYADLAHHRDHQGWKLTEKGRELVPAKA